MSAQCNYRRVTVLIALVTMLNPGWSVRAESPLAESSRARVPDVRLDRQGRFHGVVVDGEGRPLSATALRVYWTQEPNVTPEDPRTVTTDSSGRFVLEKVPAGACRLETSAGVFVCRLWTHAAAPPAAASSLLVVSDTRVERGQRPVREMFFSDPLLMATVVAAAIAIPIIVHKSRDESPEGS